MKTFQYFTAALSAFIFYASPVTATTVYVLTDGGNVLTVDHLTPNRLLSRVPITNLKNYELLAMDVRPTVQSSPSQPGIGSLWAIGKLGSNFQLFVIDPKTGVATAIGSSISGINNRPGAGWGFDFDPSVDRIRLVNSEADNYRLNPNTGTFVANDLNLRYQVGPFSTMAHADAVAYTPAVFGGLSTAYYIDYQLDSLAMSAFPNTGVLQIIGMLGVNINQPNGFDIANDLALMSVSAPLGMGTWLYSVNLATGSATFIGSFPIGINVRGLAISIPPPTPAPDTIKPVLRVTGPKKKVTIASRFNLKVIAYDNSGTVTVSFRAPKASPRHFKFIQSSTRVYTAKVRGLKYGNNLVIVRAIDTANNQAQVRVIIRRVSRA